MAYNIVVPDVSKIYHMNARIFGTYGKIDGNASVQFYSNDYYPSAATTLANFSITACPGITSYALAGGVNAGIVAGDVDLIVWPQIYPTAADGGGYPFTAYGYIVTDSTTGALLWCQRFETPWQWWGAGDVMVLTPVFSGCECASDPYVLPPVQVEVSHTVDALLDAAATVAHTVDALIQSTPQEVGHTVDALIVEAPAIAHTVDALLDAAATVAHTVDALIVEAPAIAHTVDALLDAAATVAHTVDAAITPQPSSATLTSTGTWTAPAGVWTVAIYAVGQGAAGANGSPGSNGAGGGGGGQVVNGAIAVTPGNTYNVTINGTSSKFVGDSATVTATPGSGTTGGGGTGGTVYTGGAGGTAGFGGGGGGGGSGGNANNGNAGGNSAGPSGGIGATAVTDGGAGGNGASGSGNGVAGSSPGGGGGGGAGISGVGGAGGGGQVLISWL